MKVLNGAFFCLAVAVVSTLTGEAGKKSGNIIAYLWGKSKQFPVSKTTKY